MPVSLEPIVRAEECLKPLFTPLPVLANRLYRHAGIALGADAMSEPYRHRSPSTPPDAADPLGRVAAPPEHESTSGKFYFWVDRDKGVERTQIVTHREPSRRVGRSGSSASCRRCTAAAGRGTSARRRPGSTGAAAERPPFDSEGVTYAEVAILRTDPVAHTPPTEESEVYLANALEAARGLRSGPDGQRLDIGLLRNGGTQFAGRAAIDLDFLLGKNGGHLNVNGIAGLGDQVHAAAALSTGCCCGRRGGRRRRRRAAAAAAGRAGRVQRQELRPVLHRPLEHTVPQGRGQGTAMIGGRWAWTIRGRSRRCEFFAPQQKGWISPGPDRRPG